MANGDDYNEPSAGGSMAGIMAAGRRFMGGMRSAFQGSSASAKVNVDVGGLEKFEAKIKETVTAIGKLKTAFHELAQGPKDFVTQLSQANAQLEDFIATSKEMPGAGGGKAGMTGQPSTEYAQGAQAGQGGIGAKIPSGVAAAGTAAAGAANAIFSRAGIGGTGQTGAVAADVYNARTAMSAGIAPQAFTRMLGKGFPMYGGQVDVAESLNMLAAQGMVWGGQGLAGQRGGAATTSAQMLQNLMPGLAPQQAAQMFGSQVANVRGQRMGQALFGAAASMYKPGGGLKNEDEYFGPILKRIEGWRTGDKKGVPYTKDELTMIQAPGSNIYSMLAQMEMSDDTISAFFAWAIAKASSSSPASFTGAAAQINQARGGKSLATAAQQTQTQEGQRQTAFAGTQYGALIQQQQELQKQTKLLQDIDNKLKGVYGLFERLPLPGFAKGILGKVSGWLGLGDPITQLNPDLGSRVGAMMAANPNLRINSGYRTAMQQKRFFDSGHPNAAPPGKSQHGRGRAVDLGPVDQLPWITANASKFGLDHAGGMGEPWHVQVAGSLVGDTQAENTWRQAQFAIGQGIAQQELTTAWNARVGGGSTGSAATATPAAPAGNAPGSSDMAKIGAGPGGAVSVVDAVKLLYSAGFRGEDLVDMGAIPSRESSYIPTAHAVGPKDDSWGLWQVNFLGNLKAPRQAELKAITGSDDIHQMTNPWVSAQMAYQVYKDSGSSLHPWISDGNPLNHVSADALNSARQAAKELGYITGDIGAPFRGANGGDSVVNHSPTTFHNSFSFPSTRGGGTSQIDVQRFVSQISRKLESQMRRVNTTRK